MYVMPFIVEPSSFAMSMPLRPVKRSVLFKIASLARATVAGVSTPLSVVKPCVSSSSRLRSSPSARMFARTRSSACDEGYTSAHDMLDVLVGGCSTAFGFVTILSPTQPDQEDASMPAVGGGGPYQLVTSGGRVTACKDRHGATATLAPCLNAAAYSSALTFAADRIILK